jgi:phosphatidylserine/phosphatidylglycerophosphate/cardiolipin synthase-like enzyme
MESAQQSIVIFSAFITPERAAQMGDVLRSKIAEGVKVRCITRPPNRNGSMAEELGKTALTALESLGAAIDLRNEIHEKVVLIDNRIAWFGSLNPLSHTARTTELMARVDDPSVASHIASILAVRRRPTEDYEHGAAAEPENPRCELCGGWSVLCNGKYGVYFRCAAGDDWKRNLDQLRRTRR